ncbi:winged helix DNA-binding domain-containing protein, partial [Alistipes communis]|uniref:winged helix DNA-binding domain-containing protein n=1 Tax=Alistipes communis TaxID=2585118 RepID=UPI003FD855B3
MNRLTDIRLHAQQLVAPQFDDPAELIRWMGMVQAQEYGSAKWAVALRLRTPAAAPVEEALREGRILRMHIMRPTWHFIAAEDVRWMLHLSARRIRAANASFAKGNGCGLDEGDYLRCSRLLERILGGGNHLTRQQIAGELERAGMAVDAPRLNRLMMHAETDGVVCSGADRAGKPTYALLAERVPQAVDLPEEEALALLALRYFRSHSPATFDDFVWWSGLPVGQPRRGVGALDGELLRESFGGREYLLHESWATCRKAPAHAHLLPAF